MYEIKYNKKPAYLKGIMLAGLTLISASALAQETQTLKGHLSAMQRNLFMTSYKKTKRH